MPRPSLVLQDADALTRRVRFEIGREIRNARMDAGASLRTAATRAEMSHAHLGRIERGVVPELTIEQLSRACSSVGLQLVVRAVPGTGAALDAGQLAVLGRLRRHLPTWVRVRTEVPMPLSGDRRAWDAVLGLEPTDLPVEAEARVRDLQALERRSALKLRDSDFVHMVLLVSDTLHNRRLLDLHREDLRQFFPLDSRAILAALRRGRTPPASGIVVL